MRGEKNLPRKPTSKEVFQKYIWNYIISIIPLLLLFIIINDALLELSAQCKFHVKAFEPCDGLTIGKL